MGSKLNNSDSGSRLQTRPVIIIPVYNHADQVGRVIEQAQLLNLPIIVVNDGSTDSTSDTLKKIDAITVLHHSANVGKGAAILTGLAAAHTMGLNTAITLDGDGQHRPEDGWNLLDGVNDDQPTLVIGKREGMERGKNVPWTSRFGRQFSNFWVWASGGPWLSDSQSGFRLYPIKETLALEVKARRYQFEVEVLVKAHESGIVIKEAPVQVVYLPDGERVSHFRPGLDFWRNSKTFGRLIFARLLRMFRL